MRKDRIKGKVVMVTGASRGMGAAIAKTFAREGAKVVLIARNKNDLEKIKDLILLEGGEAIVVQADVTSYDQVVNSVNKIKEKFATIDILVNCAGLGIFKSVNEMSEKEWDLTYDLNLKAVFMCTNVVVKEMIKQKNGLIINIGSMAGVVPGSNKAFAYAGSKWALVGISRTLSRELRPYNIRVVLLNPGTTDTYFRPDEEQGKHPEWLQADDVADAALFAAAVRPEVSIHEINFSVTIEGWG